MALYLITGAALLLYIVLTWFLASAFLPGSGAWILRAGLWIIGVLAAVVVVLYFRRRSPASITGNAGTVRDLDLLIREAEARLKTATTVRGVRRLSDLGTFLVLGEAGAAKTSIVVNSGLEPELMAGRAQQDGVVVPTEAGNLWFAAGQTWVELPSAALSDEVAMRQVVRGLSPRRLANVLGGSTQPPRGVVICVDCAEFLRADAVSALTGQAKRLNGALLLLAREWAVRLPVYVLFTKLDRLPYFADFVRSYDDTEAGEPLGVTLSVGSYQTDGAYAQQQTAYLSGAFDQLFRLLAARRTECLRREHELARTPNVYEHPREMRKIRDNLVRYLVELCRPSQLQASPFLRGFYFTGVRPVIVSNTLDELAAPSPDFGGATQIFTPGREQPAARPSATGAHRVAQWVYLGRFFTDVLLKDRTAQTAGGRSAHAGRNRRTLAVVAGALCLIYLVFATVSFFGNRGLLNRIRNSAAATRTGQPQERLAKLDELRKVTAEVFEYDRIGAPLHLRWGLYGGPELTSKASEAYCRSFTEQLLTPARTTLASQFQRLRQPPAADDKYEETYDNLKAYLIATANADKAEASAAPALIAAWSNGRQPAPEQLDLARRQFTFYLQHRKANFCPAPADTAAVERARRHLLGFELVARTYRNIIAEVSKDLRPITFSDPGGTMMDPREVPGAFTRAGWPRMQAAIAHAPEYYNREPWVLGDASRNDTLTADLGRKLADQYATDYLHHWQDFLAGASVVRYGGMKDAANKLKRLSGAQSALLSLFCTVSDNTKVDSPVIATPFQPIHAFTPPGACTTTPIGASNRDYMGALLDLQVQVEERADAEGSEETDLPKATQAKVVAGQTAQVLNMPQAWKKLLEDPILYAEALAKNAASMGLNGKGAGFCRSARGVLDKFPFNPRGRQEATMEEAAAVFQPQTGQLWAFFAESLQPHLMLQGNRYVKNPASKVKISSDFLAFFNNAAGVSRTLFGAPPAPGGFTYTVQAYPSPNIDGISLRIDGVTLRAGKNKMEAQDFKWPGDGSGAVLEVDAKGGQQDLKIPGLWAPFHLVAGGTPVAGLPGAVELPIRDNRSIGAFRTSQEERLANLRLRFTAKSSGQPLGDLFTLRCEPRVAP